MKFHINVNKDEVKIFDLYKQKLGKIEYFINLPKT